MSRIAAVRIAMNRLQVGRLADAALAGALVALVLSGLLGGVKLDVLGALGTLCVLLVLLLLALYDLVLRWSAIDLQDPGRSGPGVQGKARRLLRWIWPEVVLVAGIVTGHLLWTG